MDRARQPWVKPGNDGSGIIGHWDEIGSIIRHLGPASSLSPARVFAPRWSCPDLIRASINLQENLAKRTDGRVKPGNDDTECVVTRPYCTLSATKRNSPSALDTSSRMDFLPSFFS